MTIYRNRPKVTHVTAMKVSLITQSGILQIGDVRHVMPVSNTFTQGGPRGAVSFITRARHIHTATRLHYTDQEDNESTDYNLVGN